MCICSLQSYDTCVCACVRRAAAVLKYHMMHAQQLPCCNRVAANATAAAAAAVDVCCLFVCGMLLCCTLVQLAAVTQQDS
jgi:hypothetical protein